MTDTEIEREREALRQKYYGDGCTDFKNLKQPWTPEDKRRDEELWCIEMIHSCLTYGSDPYEVSEHWVPGKGYVKQSWMTRYEETLGVERVKELVEQEREEYKHAFIHVGTHTDNEGVTYNSVTFFRDQKESV